MDFGCKLERVERVDIWRHLPIYLAIIESKQQGAGSDGEEMDLANLREDVSPGCDQDFGLLGLWLPEDRRWLLVSPREIWQRVAMHGSLTLGTLGTLGFPLS